MITKGQKINDRYEIIRSIGEGGMANVYLAKDIILDRNVAIKVLRGDLAGDEKFVRRFQREALSASSLSHPNIVEMYDVGEDHGTYYIVMEYVEGMTLKQLIKKRGNLSLSEAIDIMLQITDGIKEAHDSYIIHRDLKPQNILIKENGEIKITDFGIAMALNSTQLTQTNAIMGSVHYLPPEQASGKGATIKSDIYSMGILFYELLTSKLPFKGDNAVEIALKHMKNDIPSVRSINESIPQSVENIILKATAKNPKNRYETATMMHDDLLSCLNEERLNEKKYEFLYPEHDTESENKKPVILDPPKEEEKIEEENILEDEGNNTWIWILSLIFLFIVLVLVGIFVVYPKLTEVPDVVIPNVSGMTIQKAEETLKEKGFEVKIEIEQISDEDIDAGLVVKTSPAIGRKVKKGTPITLYESLGDTIYEIENYVGRNYIEVKTILTSQYNLNVVIEKMEPEDDKEYDKQEIIKQSLEVGEKVSKGSKIILYIPNVVDEYPNFVDEEWTIEEIQNFCDEYGVVVEFVPKETEEFEENVIISQSRAAGTTIVKGANLKIVYAVKYNETEIVDPENENTEEFEEDTNQDNE
ncbi:MAG: Stk1 family PASTA domain-containing Ser/Thr kinase [Bacilli bacterium]|nr:Stk1 family PASTA domain-containing Ser/Thr kinase [Bacilli bacterium]